MWEIPVYLIFAPIITLGITFICAMKYKRYFLGVVIVFLLLNIPTVILPIIYHIGWEALFGWALVYTVVSAVVALITRTIHNKKTSVS